MSRSRVALVLGILALVAVPVWSVIQVGLNARFSEKPHPMALVGRHPAILPVISPETIRTVDFGGTHVVLPRQYSDPAGRLILAIDVRHPNSSGLARVDTGASRALGSLRLANTLEALSVQANQPAEREYLAQLAFYAYSLGMAEGVLDKLEWVELPGAYSHQAALQDVSFLARQLEEALEHPPFGVGLQTRAVANALGCEVYRISQSYTTGKIRDHDPAGSVLSLDPGVEALKETADGLLRQAVQNEKPVTIIFEPAKGTTASAP